jgi:hypothetical protein
MIALRLVQALYLFLPLLVSVALSAVVHKYDLFQWLKVPIDGGLELGGKRLFGKSKTWRGVAIALVGSVCGVALQRYALEGFARSIAVVDYARTNVLALGTTMGAAAMAGELPNSAVKRRLGIEPGATTRRPLLRAVFWTWDQVDLLLLTWPAITPWVEPTASLVAASFVLALVIHPALAWIGHAIGARTSAR